MTDVDASKDAAVVVDLIRSAMVNPTDFQPYFVAYALAHGCTPDEMHRRIVTRTKGAAMLGFIGVEAGHGPETPENEANKNPWDERVTERSAEVAGDGGPSHGGDPPVGADPLNAAPTFVHPIHRGVVGTARESVLDAWGMVGPFLVALLGAISLADAARALCWAATALHMRRVTAGWVAHEALLGPWPSLAAALRGVMSNPSTHEADMRERRLLRYLLTLQVSEADLSLEPGEALGLLAQQLDRCAARREEFSALYEVTEFAHEDAPLKRAASTARVSHALVRLAFVRALSALSARATEPGAQWVGMLCDAMRVEVGLWQHATPGALRRAARGYAELARDAHLWTGAFDSAGEEAAQ